MAREIEAKMRIADAAARTALLQRLRDLGGLDRGSMATTDLFFDTDAGELRAADCGLRLRIVSEPCPPGPRGWITFKGPREPGWIKQRREVELPVGQTAAAAELLEALGYRQRLRLRKRRHSWDLQGCRVELDRVAGLGEFVEIEGPSEPDVQRVRALLELTAVPLVRLSYAELLSGSSSGPGSR